MALFKSGNPALGEKVFQQSRSSSESETMTVAGTANKTALLVVLALGSAGFTWNYVVRTGNFDSIMGLMYGSIAVGLAIAIGLVFKPEWARYLAPVYAIVKGLALGGISAYYNYVFEGIAMQALILTFSILGAMLLLYKFRIIRATENFKMIVGAATGGIALFYLVSLLLSFANVNVPLIHSNTPMGILFSLAVVVIAALNLVMDFDFIEQGEKQGAPKYMEWYGAFALIVTIIWLYIELLRLLSKLQSRN